MFYLNKVLTSHTESHIIELHCDGCLEEHTHKDKELLGMFVTTEQAIEES